MANMRLEEECISQSAANSDETIAIIRILKSYL
jgi:hypothetical protein